MTPLLKIENLSATVGGKKVLQGLSLSINAGEVHAIMGPNGSGKSTLSYVLAGRPGYEITGGSVQFEGRDLSALEPRGARPRRTVPRLPVPGGNSRRQQCLSAQGRVERQAQGRGSARGRRLRIPAAGAREDEAHADRRELSVKRGVNEGFSGGEKKRNEILQMLVLEPKLAVLDETDSGLDIDALKVVARGVNSLRSAERGVLLITHYQRLLDHVVPDQVHVLARGRIARSGDKSLALELEKRGYDWVLEVA